MSTSTVKSASRFNPWPISIISFFSVAILGCATFITFCSRHPADLISPNYYEEEVRYQGQIDRVQRTQERAPQAAINYDLISKRINISVPSSMAVGQPQGQIQLYRPSSVKLDQTLKLELDHGGNQTIDADSLLPGLWKVRVSWTLDDRQFFIDQKIVIASANL